MQDMELEKAYHEAGHVVMAIALRIGIASATLNADEDSAAHVIPSATIAESELAFVCMVKLAGAVAAAMRRVTSGAYGAEVIGASQDFADVRELVCLRVLEHKRADFLAGVVRLTMNQTREYWQTIQMTAGVLLARRTITGAEAQTIFDFVAMTKERTEPC